MRYRRVVVSNKSMFNPDVSREFSVKPIGFSIVHWLALLARAKRAAARTWPRPEHRRAAPGETQRLPALKPSRQRGAWPVVELWKDQTHPAADFSSPQL